MQNNFVAVPRVDLNTAPVKWELHCHNCGDVHKGFYKINQNFECALDTFALVKHSVYCKECIPKMLPMVHTGNKLAEDIPDDEKVHICSICLLVSIGENTIANNVYVERGRATGYQRACKSCTKHLLS